MSFLFGWLALTAVNATKPQNQFHKPYETRGPVAFLVFGSPGSAEFGYVDSSTRPRSIVQRRKVIEFVKSISLSQVLFHTNVMQPCKWTFHIEKMFV